MTRVMRKLGAVLLSAAMFVTMMPIAAFAATSTPAKPITVYVNGVAQGTISGEWISEHSKDIQAVYPYATDKETTVAYVIAEGFSMEDALIEAGVIKGSLSELGNAKMQVWEKPFMDNMSGYTTASFFANATKVYQGGINPADGSDARTPIEGVTVKPIIAVRAQTDRDATYDAAKTKLESGEWTDQLKGTYQNYLGNTGEKYATEKKADGTWKTTEASLDLAGKWSCRNASCISIITEEDSDVIPVYVNGEYKGSIKSSYIMSNLKNQVFPYSAQDNENGKISYTIGKGFSLEGALIDCGVIKSVDDLKDATINFCEKGSMKQTSGSPITGEQLAKAVKVKKSEAGSDSTKWSLSDVDGSAAVVPSIIVSSTPGYATYEEAAKCKDATAQTYKQGKTGPPWQSSDSNNAVRTFLAGNSDDQYEFDANGKVLASSVNLTGKYGQSDFDHINIVYPTVNPDNDNPSKPAGDDKGSIPDTSDSSNLPLWCMMFAFSAALLAAAAVYYRKRKVNN